VFCGITISHRAVTVVDYREPWWKQEGRVADTTNIQFRKSPFHDEKGNRIGWTQTYEPLLAGALRVSQKLVDWPNLPWVPFAVIRELSRILNKNSLVLEFGSGRSTVWLAGKAQAVVSIEDCKAWYDKVITILSKRKLENVDYRFLAGNDYTHAADGVDKLFDLIVVDGSYRSQCLENAYGHLKPGGYLYLDNSDTDSWTTDGEMRRAEQLMKRLAEEWSSPLRFYTGFCPGNLHAHQGALLQKRSDLPN
jgi:predicted O-methyltransferase YrrM